MLSQITIPVYILFGLQFILIPFQLISYFSRKSDKRRTRFLLLTVIYVFFNALWIICSAGIYLNLFLEILFKSISLVTIGYSYYYWLKEFKVNLSRTKSRRVLLHFFAILILTSLVEHVTLLNSNWIYTGLILYAEIVSFYIVSDIIRASKRNTRNESSLLSFSILIASVIGFFAPMILFFFENFAIEYIAINAGFFFIASAYLRQYILNMRTEWNLLDQFAKNNGELTHQDEYIQERVRQYSTLTPREIEVAQLMFQNLMWKEISGMLKIEESTARKHGANIYAKFNVSRLEDFQAILEEISNHKLLKNKGLTNVRIKA